MLYLTNILASLSNFKDNLSKIVAIPIPFLKFW